MYDGKTQLLVENPINRYLINSPMLPDLKKNADGSLTIYIQKDSPGADKEVELAAGPEWPDLHGDATLLAEGGGAERGVEAASSGGFAIARRRVALPGAFALRSCSSYWGRRRGDASGLDIRAVVLLTLSRSSDRAGDAPCPANGCCQMNHDAYDNAYISRILNTVRTIAIVGASANDVRPSFFVTKYLIAKGLRSTPSIPARPANSFSAG